MSLNEMLASLHKHTDWFFFKEIKLRVNIPDYVYQTIGDFNWMLKNEIQVKKVLPETWTHMHNIDSEKLMLELQLLGVNLHPVNDFIKIMVFFELIGILLRNVMSVRRNPHSIFDQGRYEPRG
jgi:hypothetical protein